MFRNLLLKTPAPLGNERGISILETMASVVILSIVGLAVMSSSLMADKTFRRSKRSFAAFTLATSKMESMAAIDPASLDATDNSSESGIVIDGMSFSRTTTVTVNSNNSRTVTVSVMPARADQTARATITNTFALWGSN